MSFYRIEDPRKRDALVEDYVATMKRIRERAKKERMGDTYHRQELEQHFVPVVKSNEIMAEEITKALKPIKQEVEKLNKQYIKLEPELSEEEEELPRKRRRISAYGPLAREWKNKMLSQDPDVDTSFGIRFVTDGATAMGNRYVNIDGNNLIVAGKEYKGTEGLWNLITGTTKDELTRYTKIEMTNYIDLLWTTSVLHRDFDPSNPHPRANGAWKWKNLLNRIWYGWKNTAPPVSDTGNNDNNDIIDREEEEEGSEHTNDDDNLGITAVSSSGSGLRDPVKSCKVYVQKKGKCYRVEKTKGNGFYLSRHRIPSVGNGLFLRHGRNIYNGQGLFGRNSPLKNVPILGWFL